MSEYESKPTFVAINVNEYATDIESIARFDAVALAEVVRAGVELILVARPDDTEFRQRVEEAYKEGRQLLEGVEGAEAVLEILGRPFPADEPTI